MKINKIIHHVLFLMVISTGSYGQASTSSGPKKSPQKKVVFIAGTDSHGKGEHEHNGGSILLSKRLEDGVPEIKTVVYQNGWPNDDLVLNDANAIVIYCDGGGDHIIIPHLEKLDSLAAKGVGISMIHFTLEIPKGKNGDHFLNLIGGYFETDWSVNPVWTANFTSLPSHPITNGVKPFEIKDEWYYHMRFTENMAGIIPILQVLPPDSTLNRPEGTHSSNPSVRQEIFVDKKPQTLAWAYERPQGGRGFGFTGGHVHANWEDDNFRMLVLNAIAWTANAKIPKEGIKSNTPSKSELNALSKRVN